MAGRMYLCGSHAGGAVTPYRNEVLPLRCRTQPLSSRRVDEVAEAMDHILAAKERFSTRFVGLNTWLFCHVPSRPRREVAVRHGTSPILVPRRLRLLL
jgi:hypothetical protein